MRIAIYVIGSLLWAPVVAALCSNSPLLVGMAILWGALLWNSPKLSPKAKRFWRIFHKINFQIINTL